MSPHARTHLIYVLKAFATRFQIHAWRLHLCVSFYLGGLIYLVRTYPCTMGDDSFPSILYYEPLRVHRSPRPLVPRGQWVPMGQWVPKGLGPQGPTLGFHGSPPWDPIGTLPGDPMGTPEWDPTGPLWDPMGPPPCPWDPRAPIYAKASRAPRVLSSHKNIFQYR